MFLPEKFKVYGNKLASVISKGGKLGLDVIDKGTEKTKNGISIRIWIRTRIVKTERKQTYRGKNLRKGAKMQRGEKRTDKG